MELIKDDSLGKTILRFKSIPSLKVDIPTLFDEIYVLEAKETSKGIERRLITAPPERYEARTRMGGGLFETREVADFKELFKKAGRNTEDVEDLIS
jgi:myosin-crossreactive antigen